MNPSLQEVAARRARLWDAGFRPVPIVNHDASGPSPGKRPLGDNWRQMALMDPPFCITAPPVQHALNSGILCDGLRAIDIDIDDPILAREIRSLALGKFGETAIRTRRNSSRSLLLYRAANGQPPKRTVAGTAGKIEILGAGQQFVAFGVHDSGADLEWFPEAPGEITADSLTALTEEQITTFLTEASIIIGAEPPVLTNGHDHHSAVESQADPLRIAIAVASIPNSGPPNWETWNNLGMALWAATGGSALGGELFNEWSKRHPSYDADTTAERWRHYQRSPPTKIGAGTLFWLARQANEPPPMDEPPPGFDQPDKWLGVHFDAFIPSEPISAPVTETDRVFDPWNTLQPVSFPLDQVPFALREFIRSRADTLGADPCALAWACIAACSAAIHGETRMQMKRHDAWVVPPAIWVALVGAPSTKKTPIVDTAWRPLNRVQNVALAAHQRALAQWMALSKKEKEDTEKPTPPRRLVSHDGTMEALQDILVRQTRGIGVVRDELAGWLGSMEKYAPGKGGAADRAFWLQSYNGGAHVVDRVMRGTMPIENLLTVICGGIQPDRLRQFRDLTDDGLWQRFVPIIVAPAGIGSDEPPDDSVGRYDMLIDGLLRGAGNRYLRLSEGAHEIRDDVQQRMYRLEQADVLGSRFTGFIGKMVGLWGRLALVFHMIGENSSHEVSDAHADMARALLFRSVLPNAARVYTAMGGAGGDLEATQSIAGYILTKSKTRLVVSDLTNNVRVCRNRTVEEIRKLLSPLEAGGWLAPEKDFNPTAWLVNDRVHVFFAERAAKERARRAMVRELIIGLKNEDEGDN